MAEERHGRDPHRSAGGGVMFSGYLALNDPPGELRRVFMNRRLTEFVDVPAGNVRVSTGEDGIDEAVVEATVWLESRAEVARASCDPGEFLRGEIASETLALGAEELMSSLFVQRPRTTAHSFITRCHPDDPPLPDEPWLP
jgi:hypothetical protein